MKMNASIYTKSKFMGMSIGVMMIGKGGLTVIVMHTVEFTLINIMIFIYFILIFNISLYNLKVDEKSANLFTFL